MTKVIDFCVIKIVYALKLPIVDAKIITIDYISK